MRVDFGEVEFSGNHTDFDALRAHPDVDLRFIGPGQAIPPADLIILPGSKNTCNDLAWLDAHGWRAHLQRHLRYGGKVIGICGGFQMLGHRVSDPQGIEGAPRSAAGFGLLDIETTMTAHKQLTQVGGHCAFDPAAAVSGYEIHMGVSNGDALKSPAFVIEGRAEGALSPDGQVLGTYLHGIFDTPPALAALLQWAGLKNAAPLDLAQLREQSLDRIADAARPLLAALWRIGATA